MQKLESHSKSLRQGDGTIFGNSLVAGADESVELDGIAARLSLELDA